MKFHRSLRSIVLMLLTLAGEAGAVASAELYQTQAYTYGRFEARVRFATGDGVISSFFLWKPGSEQPDTFWNELDFEKLGADCRLQTNPLYGLPVVDHSEIEPLEADLCGEYHTYTFEWTPSYIAYRVDGIEVRRDGEDTATAFTLNAAAGMQIHFNVWPGDATFGGNFDPSILPVQQYISWVQYSSFANGEFTPEWREEFDGPTLPSGWAVGSWPSPKNLSTHQPVNVTLASGLAVLSLTADDATGFAGAPPLDVAAGGTAGSDPGAGPVGDTGTGGAGDLPAPSAVDGGSGGALPDDAESADSAASPSAQAAGGGAGSSPRSPDSGGGQCSQGVSSIPHAHGAAWVVIGGVGLLARRRRRR